MSTSSAQQPPSKRLADAKVPTATCKPTLTSTLSSTSASSSLSSSSSSPPLQHPALVQNTSTTKAHAGLLDAQKLLASIALSRPTPFGSIPQRRASDGGRQKRQQRRRDDFQRATALATSPPSSASQRTPTQSLYARRTSAELEDSELSSFSAGNAALHVTNAATAFHYRDEDWPRRTDMTADVKGKGRATYEVSSVGGIDDVQFSLSPSSPISSPASPQEEWEPHSVVTSSPRHTRSRQATSSRSRDSTSPSTPASSRSSSLHRKPSLLVLQNNSGPIASPYTVPTVGLPTTSSTVPNSDSRNTLRSARRSSGKESQSLAERGNLAEATLPSLYSMSRGRSAHVSPSRRWDRRGASVNVLSCAPFQLQDVQYKVNDASHAVNASTKQHPAKARADSAGSLEAALFESDDDAELFASSDEEDDIGEDTRHSQGASRASSRRTSIERDRRRELRILLAPSSSSSESQGGSQGRSFGQSQSVSAGGASEDFVGSDDRVSVGSMSVASSDKSPPLEDRRRESPRRTRRLASGSPPAAPMAVANAELADDESDGTTGPSAATILDRRAQSGRRLLPVALKSIAPARSSMLDIILAGMTPDEKSSTELQSDILETVASGHTDIDDTITTSAATRHRTPSVLVDAETDPLLGPSFGSVADNMQIDAVEWNDVASRRASKSSLVMSPTSSPRPDSAQSVATRKSVAEQEDERRTGFAAAYQNRIAALSLRLWTPGKNARDAANASAPVGDTTSASASAKAEQSAAHESLLSSSWRHLTSLPNLLLMPTLGVSASAAKAPSSVQRSEGSAASPEARDGAATLNLNAAHAAEAHLSRRQDADRTIVAIDRALGEIAQPSSSSEAYSSQDEGSVDLSSASVPSKRVAEDVPPHSPSRSGRGVMTPLEADADISAYVSGLGLPIDPDVELSSVVHLQTFRIDSRARRATSVSRQDPAGTTAHRRRVSEDFAASRRAASPPAKTKGRESLDALFVGAQQQPLDPSPSTTSSSEIKSRTSAQRRRSPSFQRKPADRNRAPATLPRCSRPAVSAPVPGDFTAYSDHSHSEEDSHGSDTTCSDAEQHHAQVKEAVEVEAPRAARDEKDEERSQCGRGRRSRQRRSTSPASQQQCAIGLFSSTPMLSRTRSGSRRLQGLAVTAAPVPRVRSSPNLSTMSVTLYEDGKQSSAASSAANSDEEEKSEDLFSGRRGRAGSVKRVSASVSATFERLSTSPRKRRASDMGNNVIDMHGSPPTSEDVKATAIEGSSPLSMRRHSLPNAAAAGSQQALAAAAAMQPGSASSSRLPIVGAESITHLAGRPSMVSNGAHLLMLSLELEMMRNRKITGSLKPRWLKARMRTEPFGPAAIVALMAERALSGSGGEGGEGGAASSADENCNCGDGISLDNTDTEEPSASSSSSPPRATSRHAKHATPHHSPAATHKHRAHIGLHTSHHRAHCSSGRHGPRQHRTAHTAIPAESIAAQPRRGSSLRFEVMPSAAPAAATSAVTT